MSIKKATLIALCGNAVYLVIYLFLNIQWIFLHPSFRSCFSLIGVIAASGTLLLFLLTLYRKQP
jgi:hypothetical protein